MVSIGNYACRKVHEKRNIPELQILVSAICMYMSSLKGESCWDFIKVESGYSHGNVPHKSICKWIFKKGTF